MDNLNEDELREKFNKINCEFMDMYYLVNKKITNDEIDDIIFILHEFDNNVPSYIYDDFSNYFNLKRFLECIKKYTDEFGLKELLVFLFFREIFLIESNTLIKNNKRFTKDTHV